jgi:predicted amidohydrolase
MRVACLQMRSGVSPEENLATLEQMVATAASQGAHYVQTPEMTALVAQNRKILFAGIEPDDGLANQHLGSNRVIAFASDLARRHHVWLHLGSIAVRISDTKAANRGLLFAPDGTRVADYDKLHMFDVDLPNNESWRESSLYQAGNKAVMFDAGEFKVGLSICYDLRFAALYRSLAQAGAQILTCPAAFTRQTGGAHWHALLRSRAIENGAFVIAAAQGGNHEDGRETYGHSLIVNPWGEIIGELKHDHPDILICDIDLNEVDIARSRIPSLSNDRQFATIATHWSVSGLGVKQ